MARILDQHSGEIVNLQSQHIFGRHPTSTHTVLPNPDASRMHAVITWDGEFWWLQDSSSNGTLINNSRMQSGGKVCLKTGDQIVFGNNTTHQWQLLDVVPPQSMLKAISPSLSDIILEDIVALPSEQNPDVVIYMTAQGSWVCESQSGTTLLKSGDQVGVTDNVWQFIEAAPCVQTQMVVENQPTSPRFTFNVSQNEEHVFLKIQFTHQEIDLGQRTHHYLLLLLARKRQEDKVAGLQATEQGWIDKELLSDILKLSENHINIQIYRFRKQLISALLPKTTSFPQVIERRRREVRFGYEDIDIQGGTMASTDNLTVVG
ncbi:FHA domain-containing protein [Endozoicomonas sp. SM1973]|uniref:FHA domain-containing protein n=1 Tax=Spartinivicinus marinus TaxID=2994442 RepID=A0A853ICM8_9GAMM|nr:FHA domain-containing protein [Spartinivicinus marinus]MCX4029674.1 FHA domain-containing protein [Spartinivicinus marinus]NYZ66945.1 FHA domain-containing protein [Spartinivicinus marinus]